MMENRKPMDLKRIIIAYNIFQIASCSFIVYIVRLKWFELLYLVINLSYQIGSLLRIYIQRDMAMCY